MAGATSGAIVRITGSSIGGLITWKRIRLDD
jgi:hypothetical protein